MARMVDGATDADEVKLERGAPLIATWGRWAAIAAALAAVVVGLTYAYADLSAAKTPMSDRVLPMIGAWLLLALAALAMLRAEESRLMRELRTARSGTSMMRGMVLRRRDKQPIFLRLFSTTLGTAAVLVAEGERGSALDALVANSPLVFGGRIQQLRELIELDAERTSGTSIALERCVERVRAMPPFGNTEADRYKTHVLVKAVLQQARGDLAAELAESLAQSKDDEQRIYAVWLRTWFDLDGAPEPADGELRLATLLARAQGGEELVKKLEEKIAARDAAALQPDAPAST